MPPLPIPRGPKVHFLSESWRLPFSSKCLRFGEEKNPEPEKSGNKHRLHSAEKNGNKHGLHSAASHTPRNMSTAILLRLLSLSSMRDSWIGACEETKGLYHDGAGTR